MSERRVVADEACLSAPGLWWPLERSYMVTARGRDMFGKPVTVRALGTLARVLQHEVDHLDGVLFADRLPEEERERFLRAAGTKICPASRPEDSVVGLLPAGPKRSWRLRDGRLTPPGSTRSRRHGGGRYGFLRLVPRMRSRVRSAAPHLRPGGAVRLPMRRNSLV
nr:hypothetical protein GCM10020093_027180 [Planobispora longispora]